jgi:hypothetical protein
MRVLEQRLAKGVAIKIFSITLAVCSELYGTTIIQHENTKDRKHEKNEDFGVRDKALSANLQTPAYSLKALKWAVDGEKSSEIHCWRSQHWHTRGNTNPH